MIIVSQDRQNIVNFENIMTIRLGYNGKYIVRAENQNKVCELGEYATEKRANEVLEEITEKYENIELAKYDRTSFATRDNFIYRMPKG